MDPTANLMEQLNLAERISTGDPGWTATEAERLAELVIALDEWLCRGGALPKPWKDAAHP